MATALGPVRATRRKKKKKKKKVVKRCTSLGVPTLKIIKRPLNIILKSGLLNYSITESTLCLQSKSGDLLFPVFSG